MRDLEIERRFPAPLYRPDAVTRCPSCFAIPRASYCSVVYGNVVASRGQIVYVVTCSSHYCRSRAAEIAGLR